jgi:hypothetical protein
MSDYAIEQKHRKAFETPKYTMTPNILFDDLMQEMGEAELKVTLCIIRKIIGYHKTRPEAVSLSQVQEMTGLSRQGAKDGIEKVLERGLIRKAGTGKRGVFLYTLVYSDDQSIEETRTNQASRPELVKPVDTQKKVVKENKKDIAAKADTNGKAKERKANPVFDWFSMKVFRIDPYNPAHMAELKRNSGRIGKLVNYANSKGAMVEQLDSFKKWYEGKYPQMDLPKDDSKFSNHFKDYMDSIVVVTKAVTSTPVNDSAAAMRAMALELAEMKGLNNGSK